VIRTQLKEESDRERAEAALALAGKHAEEEALAIQRAIEYS